LLIEDYQRQLTAAGFSKVQVIDSGADLNAYAKVENQASCCAPAVSTALPQTGASCCAPAPGPEADTKVFEKFTDLLSRYNVNDYATSVKVFAIK
jgi:hypothetical protein